MGVDDKFTDRPADGPSFEDRPADGPVWNKEGEAGAGIIITGGSGFFVRGGSGVINQS